MTRRAQLALDDFLRRCVWCDGAIPAGSRSDARHCSTRCRQAAHRTAIRRASIERTHRPLRLAYADPPYPGLARYYAGHPDFAGEVALPGLLADLVAYDGWALSTSARSLGDVLAIARAVALDAGAPVPSVAAWLRGRPVPHPSAAILNAWEPVLYVPARRTRPRRQRATPDALAGRTPRRRPTLPADVIGAKPPDFAVWLFGLLGARPGDSLEDLFPGSGAIARAWSGWAGPDTQD